MIYYTLTACCSCTFLSKVQSRIETITYNKLCLYPNAPVKNTSILHDALMMIAFGNFKFILKFKYEIIYSIYYCKSKGRYYNSQ